MHEWMDEAEKLFSQSCIWGADLCKKSLLEIQFTDFLAKFLFYFTYLLNAYASFLSNIDG